MATLQEQLDIQIALKVEALKRVAELEERDRFALATLSQVQDRERDKADDLRQVLYRILPILREGAHSGMVPFQGCKDAYALVCKAIGIEPKP